MFERYSDSAGNYVVLDPNNQAVYKQLYRAAKAKTKLRIKVTVSGPSDVAIPSANEPTNASEVTLVPTALPLHPASEAPKELPSANIMKSTEADIPVMKHLPKAGNLAVEKSDEALLPRPFALRDQFYEDLANAAKLRSTSLRAKDQAFQVPLTSFTVQCNYCGTNIPSAHWHCNVCDHGDFDLCQVCIESGIHCDIDDHYLIKRTIEDGKVKYSTSNIVDKKAPKPEPKAEEKKEMPGTFDGDIKEEPLREQPTQTRTCNCCVNGTHTRPQESRACLLNTAEYEESNFVTCLNCEDYDLCIPCHYSLKHGHHPNHAFAPVSQDVHLDSEGSLLCTPGRNLRHFATCDGCDKVSTNRLLIPKIY